MEAQISDIIAKFKLIRHPIDGFYFIETLRGTDTYPATYLNQNNEEERSSYSVIYVLLTPDKVNSLHRINYDAVLHFYLGDPVEHFVLSSDGKSQIITMGQDIINGQKVQQVIPKGSWHGSRLQKGGRYALLGLSFAPGFNFNDLKFGDRKKLCAEHPDQCDMITALTHEKTPKL